MPLHESRPKVHAAQDQLGTEEARVLLRVADELKALVRALAQRSVSHEAFIREVLRIEKQKVSRHGLSLVGSNTIDDWTCFVLRSNKSRKVCGHFEFLPETGECRRLEGVFRIPSKSALQNKTTLLYNAAPRAARRGQRPAPRAGRRLSGHHAIQ